MVPMMAEVASRVSPLPTTIVPSLSNVEPLAGVMANVPSEPVALIVPSSTTVVFAPGSRLASAPELVLRMFAPLPIVNVPPLNDGWI